MAQDGKQFQSIEIVRFIASLSVIFWHYQFFFFDRAAQGDYALLRNAMPLYKFLFVFYNYGYFAVQWFWVLSGFVFFLNYRDLLEGNRMTGRTFLSRRVARLYPLHIASLLMVTALQASYYLMFGSMYWNYSQNLNFSVFLSHIFMASNWISGAATFNGPIWSVSIEVLIYILFFVLTKYLPLKGKIKYILIITFFVVIQYFSIWMDYNNLIKISQCAACFWLGGVVYDASNRHAAFSFGNLSSIPHWRAIAMLSAAAVLIIVCFYFWLIYYVNSAYAYVFVKQALGVPLVSFVMPALGILFAANMDANDRWKFLSKVAWVGNLTYGSYLLHFPLALLIVICLRATSVDLKIAYSPFFLVSYVVGVITISDLSYKYLEAPARRVIRRFG